MQRRPPTLFLCLVLLVGALAGCAQGAAEFQLYVQAFEAQYQQGDAILNSVARAERTLVLTKISNGASLPDFEPDKAAYYVENVDPPITAMLRSSLNALRSYNNALGALAGDEAAEALTNRMSTIATNLASALAASHVALAGPAAIAGGDKLVSHTADILSQALPFFKTAARLAAHAAFREQLIAAYPVMRDLLSAMRDATPAMFEVLKRSYVEIGALGKGPLGISADRRALLEKDRELLAGWVVLMDKTQDAMKAAVDASLGNGSAADLAMLSETSIELRVLSEQVKNLRTKQ